MAFSKDWTDWHLTPNGWIKGNSKTTFSSLVEREFPSDRLLTKRYEERQATGNSKSKCSNEIIWKSEDKIAIEESLNKYPFPFEL